LIKLICLFFSLFPRKVVRLFGRPLGILWFDILRFRRQVVLSNLRIAFPDWSEEKRIQIGRQSVYNMLDNFFELFLIPTIDQKWIDRNIIFHDEHLLKEAFAKNKGVFLLSLHLGNGDLLANLLAFKKYPVFLITKFFRSQWLNRLWFSVRGAQGVQYIEPHGERTPFAILKAIKNKASVGFVLDQHMGRPFGVRNVFFGRPVGTAYGLALFVLKTQSPVVLAYNYEGADGKNHAVFETIEGLEKFYQIDSADREQTLVLLTQVFTDKIEEIVRRYPEQWMWIHRRWKWKGS